MKKAPLFGIVAGEKSGDVLGAGLIAALKGIYPDAKFVGIGGADMEAQGCESLADIDRLSVMGFVEPLGRLPELFAIKKRLREYFIEHRPVAFIGVDAPDFNLRLAAELKLEGIKTVQYVSPSVWAYREGRIHKIKRAIDLMLTLFPFETDIYIEHEIPVHCVGHPLADDIGFEDNKLSSRVELGLKESDAVVALMPGSRGGEIKRLGSVFLEAAIAALEEYPQLKFIIPFSSDASKSRIEALLRNANIFPDSQFQLVSDSHLAISAADYIVLASGTATLEAMLLKRPMVVGYKIASLTYAIASRILKIPHVALPNLLARKLLVPEYLQNDLNADVLKTEILRHMSGKDDHSAMLEEFDTIHRSIRLDASKQGAAAISKMVEAAADSAKEPAKKAAS